MVCSNYLDANTFLDFLRQIGGTVRREQRLERGYFYSDASLKSKRFSKDAIDRTTYRCSVGTKGSQRHISSISIDNDDRNDTFPTTTPHGQRFREWEARARVIRVRVRPRNEWSRAIVVTRETALRDSTTQRATVYEERSREVSTRSTTFVIHGNAGSGRCAAS